MTEAGAYKLDPDAVRRRASSIPGCREVLSSIPSQVSFLTGVESREIDHLARVTVFCESATVGIGRVLGGQVRQVFRRNVTQLDVVERLLRQPPALATIDASLIGLTDEEEDEGQLPKEMTLQSEIELAEVGMAILQGEKEKLENHLTAIQPLPAPQAPATPESSSDTASLAKDESWSSLNEGMEFQFSLSASAMKHVDQCLRDIQKMGKLVRSVATNGNGTVFLYGNGGVAYTPNIPRNLHQRFSQLRNSRMASRPSYVALGTRDRYFCAFHDGSFTCKGPKGLDKELKKLSKPPQSVAFGPTWDTFFIVFHNGSWKFQGRSIPEQLEERLKARQDRPDLLCVHLGPHGEWFLKARNGRMWWGGVGEETDQAILDLLEAGHSLNVMDFGADHSYFVSYD